MTKLTAVQMITQVSKYSKKTIINGYVQSNLLRNLLNLKNFGIHTSMGKDRLKAREDWQKLKQELKSRVKKGIYDSKQSKICALLCKALSF